MSDAGIVRPRVFLVRHGETDWNRSERLLSFTDMPLNERGRAQATALGAALAVDGIPFDRVLCSPKVRATQTADLVLGALPSAPGVELDERLVEVDFGPLEGWTHEELMADDAARAWRMGGGHPGVESDAAVAARAMRVWADLPVTGTTLVVAHGRFLRAVVAMNVLGLPLAASTRMRMRNCRPAIVEPGPEPLLLAFNAGLHFRV
jgi:broad specificity phosphatase PhoE